MTGNNTENKVKKQNYKTRKFIGLDNEVNVYWGMVFDKT